MNSFNSIRYLYKSSENGNKSASYLLGLLYESGSVAKSNFEICKSKKFTWNQSFSCFLFEEGKVVKQNISQAIEYYQKSADGYEEKLFLEKITQPF